jgi:hypothetical protein
MPYKNYEDQLAWIKSPTGKASRKRRYNERRTKLFKIYGGECACCGETMHEFLSLNHVNGGGSKDRKMNGRSVNNKHITQIINSGKTNPEFNILCHNCNMSLGFYGRCPHNAS